jgi:hypothetical protein
MTNNQKGALWPGTDLLEHLVASSAVRQANGNAEQAPDRRR